LASILIVCTANVCRSPYAAALLTDHAARSGRSGVRIQSAGTRAADGQSLCSGASALLRTGGVGRDAADDHRSRKLELDLVRGAELILVASLEHRSEIAYADAAARRRTFTFKEAAAYLGELASLGRHAGAVPVGDGALFQIAEAMNSLRGTVAIREGLPVAPRLLLRQGDLSAQRRLDIRDGHLQGPLHHKVALYEVRRAVSKIHLGLSELGGY
jgi:protein-tyrosine phosphatase